MFDNLMALFMTDMNTHARRNLFYMKWLQVSSVQENDVLKMSEASGYLLFYRKQTQQVCMYMQ